MPFHVLGWELSASNAALTDLVPIVDGIAQVSGNTFFVPKGMDYIVCATALINSPTATLRAQIITPSLRAVFPVDISPINNGLVFGSLPRIVPYFFNPLPIVDQEPLEVQTQNGAAVMNRIFLTIADAALKPTTGKIYTVRFTTSITLVTATWANGALTFGTTLPAGNYQVVGARVWSANGVYARFFFKGSFFRPGVPMINAEDNNEWSWHRMGNVGVFDQFNNVTPPSLDAMGVTDTAQQGYLDLIKVS